MAKSNAKVPKTITVKIPKALRKSRLVKSLLANKLDHALLASAIIAAAGAAALALTRQSTAEGQAPAPAQHDSHNFDIVVRTGTNGSGNREASARTNTGMSDFIYPDDGEEAP